MSGANWSDTEPTHGPYDSAFVNLSSLTKDSTRKPTPLFIIKPDAIYSNRKDREDELNNHMQPNDIDSCQFTAAGNIMIFCTNNTAYHKLLNKKTLFGK